MTLQRMLQRFLQRGNMANKASTTVGVGAIVTAILGAADPELLAHLVEWREMGQAQGWGVVAAVLIGGLLLKPPQQVLKEGRAAKDILDPDRVAYRELLKSVKEAKRGDADILDVMDTLYTVSLDHVDIEYDPHIVPNRRSSL